MNPGAADDSRAATFDRDGFVVVPGLLQPPEIEWYRALYERFLSGAIDVGRRRSGLGWRWRWRGICRKGRR